MDLLLLPKGKINKKLFIFDKTEDFNIIHNHVFKVIRSPKVKVFLL